MKKIIFAVTVLLCSAYSFWGQEIRTGYFLENYTHNYRLNPAFQTPKNFVGGILSISAGTQSNLGFSTLFYPRDGELVTFLHPSVDADEFLSKIKLNSKLNVDVKENIASYGFWKKYNGKDYFNTLELNWVNQTSAKIPKRLFEFLKGDAPDDFSYDLSNVRGYTQSYLEFAAGSSAKFGKLTLGARAKFLIGMNSIRINVKEMYADLNSYGWGMWATASFDAAGGGVKRKLKESAKGDDYVCDLSKVRFKPFGFGGFGMGVDLGAKYEFNEYINVSAALKDIGVMYWYNKATGYSEDYKWIWNGDIGGEIEEEANVMDALNDLISNVESIYEFLPRKKHFEAYALNFSANIGAEFKMPFYDKLSVGILGTSIFNRLSPFHEIRASVNATPLKWLSLSLSTGYSTYGWEIGGMMSVYAKKFSVFLGTDNYYYKMTPQFMPVKEFNTHVSFGIHYLFGGKRS